MELGSCLGCVSLGCAWWFWCGLVFARMDGGGENLCWLDRIVGWR